MRHVVQPGPVAAQRQDLVACEGAPLSVTLAPGIPLEDAVALALAPLGFDAAWLEVEGAAVTTLDYLIPAHATDDAHAAWYSDVYAMGPGQIDRLGMIVGCFDGASFLHGHGLWTGRDGVQRMGHILAPRTQLAAPVLARGIGLKGATFDRRHDPETNFDLFHVDGQGAAGPYAGLRLRPNQEITQALEAACATLGWDAARVYGLGSLISATFADGTQMDSLPTEFLITDARAGQGGHPPEIAIVGVDGDTILTGRLARGENPVLITAELVLERLGPES